MSQENEEVIRKMKRIDIVTDDLSKLIKATSKYSKFDEDTVYDKYTVENKFLKEANEEMINSYIDYNDKFQNFLSSKENLESKSGNELFIIVEELCDLCYKMLILVFQERKRIEFRYFLMKRGVKIYGFLSHVFQKYCELYDKK